MKKVILMRLIKLGFFLAVMAIVISSCAENLNVSETIVKKENSTYTLIPSNTSTYTPMPTRTPTVTPSKTNTASPTPSKTQTPVPSPVYKSGDFCIPPCWKGIIPRETREDELENIISISDIEVKHEWDYREYGYDSFAIVVQDDENAMARIIIREGYVERLFVWTLYRLPIETIISHYGNPVGYSCVYPLLGQPVMNLFYPDYGMDVYLILKQVPGKSYDFSANTMVLMTIIQHPYEVGEYVKEMEESKNPVIHNAMDFYSDWKGFGDVNYCECEDTELCEPLWSEYDGSIYLHLEGP
jgi:hypothetical protein